jgi:protoporphyrinogen oxidase
MDPRLPGLFLGGHHLDGPGLKDCARQGARLAEEISAWLRRSG